MRLWHKDLIPVLPDKQLISQWRECCAIAGNIAKFGGPHHLLVNKIMEYPIDHFFSYTFLVMNEMDCRGFAINPKSYQNFEIRMINFLGRVPNSLVPINDIFKNWHTGNYCFQCVLNLMEKHDCGMSSNPISVSFMKNVRAILLICFLIMKI